MASREEIVYNIKVNADKSTATIRNLKGQIVATKVPVEQLRNEFGNFAKQVNSVKFDKFNKGLKSATTANKGLSNATGAASSSAMELSRVISDAPYGIRGMANNITQLVSQLGYQASATNVATGATYGYAGALKAMWKAFMGPLGVVLAITAAVSALDFFYGANKKAEKSISDLTSKTYAASLVSKGYVDELEDINISEERRQVVTQELIKLVPTLTKQDLKYGENLDKVRLKIRSYSLAQASRIQIDNLVQENSEVLAAKNELESIKQIEDSEERLERMKEFILEVGKDISGFYLGFGQEGLINKGNVDATEEEFKRLGRVVDKESEPIMKRISELTQSLELDPLKNGSKGGSSEGKDKVGLLDLFGIIDPEKEAKKAQKMFNRVKDIFTKSLFKDGKFNDFSKNPKTTLNLLPKPTEEQVEEFKLSLEQYVDMYKDIMGGISDFIGGEFDRQMTIEENKTNALNTELNNRLLNENLSAQQRKSIQNSIWQNDEALRVKQEQIAKKKFQTEKAFNISMAVVETYAGATKALNDPSVPSTIARFALAGATIAKGLLSVATISRQKFQSSNSSTPINSSSGGGGGDGVGDRSFDFNLVGNTQENQLANAIQSQFNKPLQAFVVSKDITTQQELDLTIKSSATF